MFGLGFSEILLIAVIAILFLGPDKLPEAMVQIAKFMNSFKKTVSEAKSAFEEEIQIRELREEALSYKRTLEEASGDISGFKNSIPNPAKEINEALETLNDPILGRKIDDESMNDILEAEADSQNRGKNENNTEKSENSDGDGSDRKKPETSDETNISDKKENQIHNEEL